MKLHIHLTPSNIHKRFIQRYVLPRIYLYVQRNIFKPVLNMYDEITRKNIKHMLFQRDYLHVVELKNEYIVEVDPVQIVTGTDAKLCVLASLLENGSLDFMPMKCFTKAFERIQQELPILYRTYFGGI